MFLAEETKLGGSAVLVVRGFTVMAQPESAGKMNVGGWNRPRLNGPSSARSLPPDPCMRDRLLDCPVQDGGADGCSPMRMPLGRCRAERLLVRSGF